MSVLCFHRKRRRIITTEVVHTVETVKTHFILQCVTPTRNATTTETATTTTTTTQRKTITTTTITGATELTKNLNIDAPSHGTQKVLRFIIYDAVDGNCLRDLACVS